MSNAIIAEKTQKRRQIFPRKPRATTIRLLLSFSPEGLFRFLGTFPRKISQFDALMPAQWKLYTVARMLLRFLHNRPSDPSKTRGRIERVCDRLKLLLLRFCWLLRKKYGYVFPFSQVAKNLPKMDGATPRKMQVSKMTAGIGFSCETSRKGGRGMRNS